MSCFVGIGVKNLIVLIGAATLSAGCSSTIETRVTSSGVRSPATAAYMISTVAETSPELRNAYMLVAAAMGQKGFSIAKEAPLHLEITLDARAAGLALGGKDGPGSLSKAKQKKPLQSCEDREYRLGVTLTRADDGAEIYRGRAAEYHCKLPVREALPALVTAAMADFGDPRGSYAISRQGRE